jgi:hypothetical protein
MDRDRDLDRTYQGHDFHGVATNLYKSDSVFADSAFEADIASLYKGWSSSQVNLTRVPRNVLGRNTGPDNSTWVLHEVGSWVEGGDVDRYTRWSYSGSPFGWQIEVDVDLSEAINKSEPSNYTAHIRERYAAYSTLFEAGNFSGLVADLYTSDAVLALTNGSFVQHDSLEHSLSQFYGKDPHHVFSVSAVGNKGVNALHDIGTVSNVSQRYYTRWEWSDHEWKIAVQVERPSHDGHHHQPHDYNLEVREQDVLVA